MKTTVTFSSIAFSVSLLASLPLSGQRLHIEGSSSGLITTATPIARIEATSLTAGGDILELLAPAGSPSNILFITSGEYLECQKEDEVEATISVGGKAYLKRELQLGTTIDIAADSYYSSAEMLLADADDNQTIKIRAKDVSTNIGGEILLYGDSLRKTVEIDGNWSGTNRGRVITDELQIVGGSDLAENFDVRADDALKPGLLVSIDPAHPGELALTQRAYDVAVAGVISGANGVHTGFFMGQRGTDVADGHWPVALAGRVYVLADADLGAIEPGDLLTSAPTPGHAMKVRNRRKAQGAVIGKAMTGLAEGKGHVLVLISLQ